jgi:hypothetical protein
MMIVGIDTIVPSPIWLHATTQQTCRLEVDCQGEKKGGDAECTRLIPHILPFDTAPITTFT